MAILVLGGTSGAQAQSAAKDKLQDRNGRVIEPDDASAKRPNAGRGNKLPTDIKDMIAKFEKDREAYLQQQKDLLKQLKGATDEERDKIREQLGDSRDKWLDQAKSLREEIRSRIAELRDKLPHHGDILDAAKEHVDGNKKRKGE